MDPSIKVHGSARHIARIAAIQAVYQIELNPDDRAYVISQFINDRFKNDLKTSTEPDLVLFEAITDVLQKDLHQYDELIGSYLSEKWTLKRLPSLTRAILRCAIYELHNEKTVPALVVLNEYVEAAKDFLEKNDVGFIHGVLDKIAKTIRPL